MVIMENPINMDDLGHLHIIPHNSICYWSTRAERLGGDFLTTPDVALSCCSGLGPRMESPDSKPGPKKKQPNGDGSKPWYLVNIKIAGKWMFIHVHPTKNGMYRY
jgi:hypothetical protein